MKGAGTIEALGPGETDLMVGDRVAYACQPPGAYAEQRLMPTAGLVKLPDTISFEAGAAMMLQGLTVQYLFRRTFRLIVAILGHDHRLEGDGLSTLRSKK